MAQRLGGLIRDLREARQLTQARLYADLLSRRQAIRFENGENDIKASVLFVVLDRLEVAASDVQSLITPSAQASGPLMLALARLNLWQDWPLTDEELQAVQQYLFTDSQPALATLRQISGLVDTSEDAFAWRSYEHLWRKGQGQQGQADYAQTALKICVDACYAALFGHQSQQAALFLKRGLALIATADLVSGLPVNGRVQLRFLNAIAVNLSQGRAAVEAATTPIITALRALGEPLLADTFVDNRRHILTSYDLHAEWSQTELGSTARLLATFQRQVPDFDFEAYINLLPGLKAALAGRPLSAFAAEEEPGEAASDLRPHR